MEVTGKLTMAEYDDWSRKYGTKKIPDWRSKDIRRHVGDSIYDFKVSPPVQRRGVHKLGNVKTDLSGKNVLLSRHFYYFGNAPIEIPEYLWPIIHPTQGHKVHRNAPYVAPFLKWFYGLQLKPNKLYGQPAYEVFPKAKRDKAAAVRGRCAKADNKCRPC